MNAIEQRFFDAFVSYVNGSPKASIHSDSWEMKIAEYDIDKKDITEEKAYLCFNTGVIFPSLYKEIKNNCLSVYVNPQEKIGSYIVDFEVYIEGFKGGIVALAIEIDGHDFHEKTKEQAGYDKRRDREISLLDYYVLRYTGSEIYTNAVKCVQEVMNILITLTFERYIKYPEWFIEESIQFDNVINGDIK